MIKYVIFDKDGTLIDTEPLFYKSWVTVGEKWGLPGMKENYFPNIAGKSVKFSIKFLNDTYGEDFDSEGFMTERMAMVKDLLSGAQKSELSVSKYMLARQASYKYIV